MHSRTRRPLLAAGLALATLGLAPPLAAAQPAPAAACVGAGVLVVGSGIGMPYRKGADLFLDLARLVDRAAQLARSSRAASRRSRADRR